MVTIYIIHGISDGGGGDRSGRNCDISTRTDRRCWIVVMICFVCCFCWAHTVIRISVASTFWILPVAIVPLTIVPTVVIVMIRVLIVTCDGCRCGCFVIIFVRALWLRFLLEFAWWTSRCRCISIGRFRLIRRIFCSRCCTAAYKCWKRFSNIRFQIYRSGAAWIYLIEIDVGYVLLVFVASWNFQLTNYSHDQH